MLAADGTIVPVIDATYGHLAIDADCNDRDCSTLRREPVGA